jgi:hypothetical protein
MRDYEFFQILGQMLDDRFEHVATKADIVQLRAENQGIRKDQKEHFEKHKVQEATLRKVKLGAIGAIVTGLITMGLGAIF